MRVAAIQMRSGTDVLANCERFEEMVRQAASQGAGYVQTPEMTGIVQKNPKALFAQITDEDNDPLLAMAGRLSRELGIWLHIGSHAIRLSDERAANRAFLFDPNGECTARYDKIHMFDVDLDNGESWRESKIYQPGTGAFIAALQDIPIGLSICYDLRFPHLYRAQALAGAQILTVPAAFTRQTGQAHWEILLRARAIENGAFVIAAAQVGLHEDGRETFGHSMIISPWGEIVGEVVGDEPGILVRDLDLLQVAKARGKVPNLANSRDFVLEHVSVNTEAAQ